MASHFLRAYTLLIVTSAGLLTTTAQHCMNYSTGCTLYSKDTVTFSKKRKIEFFDHTTKCIEQKLNTIFISTHEGCTRGAMRKCARAYKSYGNNAQEYEKQNNAFIEKMIGPKKYSPQLVYDKYDEIDLTKATNKNCINPEIPDDKYFALWLWSEKKCNNNQLKQFIQLLCVDPHAVGKALCELAKNKQNGWLLEEKGKKANY